MPDGATLTQLSGSLINFLRWVTLRPDVPYFTNVSRCYAENCRFTNCFNLTCVAEMSFSFVLSLIIFVFVRSACRNPAASFFLQPKNSCWRSRQTKIDNFRCRSCVSWRLSIADWGGGMSDGCRLRFPLQLLPDAVDDHIVRCGIISSCQSAATSEIVKGFWSRVWHKPLYAEVFAVVSVAVTIKLFSSSWRNPTSRCSNVF